MDLRHTLEQTRKAWPVLSGYERFEQIITLVLSGLVGIVIVVATLSLARHVFRLVFEADVLDHGVFQSVFGMIMTLLIALEFNHSILHLMERGEHIIQVKTVLLIALLALSRKFIILDLSVTSAAEVAAMAAALFALGGVYWLMRQRDDRLQLRASRRGRTPPRTVRERLEQEPH